jgi:hypothetical protein
MPSPYTGNPDNWSDPIDVPDDSDPPDAADIGTPMEALIDDVAHLAQGGLAGSLANIAALEAVNTTGIAAGSYRYVIGFGRYILNKSTYATFFADGVMVVAPTTGTGRWLALDSEARLQYVVSWTNQPYPGVTWPCPPTLNEIEITIENSGGGGGGGYGGVASGTTAPSGGGGGAGGRRVVGRYLTNPGGNHAVFADGGGAGGAGGAALNPGADGSDGGASGISRTGPVQFISSGGMGGSGGGASSGTDTVVTPGGSTAPGGSPHQAPYNFTGNSTLYPTRGPGSGGYALDGFSGAAAGAGSQADNFTTTSSEGLGGAAGAAGVAHTNAGGRGGGGGGGAALGNGGSGGAGGSGAASGDGGNGVAGGAASGNAGGGGGGGGGVGSTAVASTGGAGGAGGPATVTIRGIA